ncbi:MAG: tetratricopeptide repeat protein [Clostridiales Family XIII bacterium]|jgi:tetratricopeptide (TPR) repeat protein|nr:tetratricopeptide repeat protein [Clostridiales Family XIII bacterium]
MFGIKKSGETEKKRGKDAAPEKTPAELDLKERPDRVGKYLKKHMKRFVFDEFAGAYIEREKLEFMAGVPIPLRKEDLKAFRSPSGLPVLLIGENMAWVIGSAPHFVHAKTYVQYLRRYFRKKAAAGLVREAKNAAEKEDYDNACIHFRAALCAEPTDLAAMYGYARVCRAMYLQSENAEYIGNFKAEALEFFELTTEIHPRFSQAYYYLGYAYLNLGLYRKAQLAWKDFLAKSTHPQDRREIRERIRQLSAPLEIEAGYNHVLAQRWLEGISKLEPFLQSNYRQWWPLHYYLGVAYIAMDRRDEAVERFKQALKLNPSHVETMEELAFIYEVEENRELAEKFRNKAELLRAGGHKGAADSGGNSGGKKGSRMKTEETGR